MKVSTKIRTLRSLKNMKQEDLALKSNISQHFAYGRCFHRPSPIPIIYYSVLSSSLVIHSPSKVVHSISSFVHSPSKVLYITSSFIQSPSKGVHSPSHFVHCSPKVVHNASSFIHNTSKVVHNASS